MLHVIIIKTTQFLLRKHLFFSFASAAYLQRKSLYLSLFDCQNLFTANKLIRLQRTRPGDRGINDAAKSTCSETTRHRYGHRERTALSIEAGDTDRLIIFCRNLICS